MLDTINNSLEQGLADSELSRSHQYFPSAELPTASQTFRWFGLQGVSKAMALLEAQQKSARPLFIVTTSPAESAEWVSYFDFLLDGEQSPLSVVEFPDRETLPYDHFSPHPDIISDRLLALYSLRKKSASIFICTLSALTARVCPAEFIDQNTLALTVGEILKEKSFINHLVKGGYKRVESVFEHGDFAVRGGIIDLFPMGSQTPYRIELFDEEIESLRSFDVETQRTDENLQEVMILPANEISLDSVGINTFRDNWHLEFHNDPDQCPVYAESVAGIPSAGIEAYLPMFFEKTSSLFDYVDADTVFVLPNAFPDKLDTLERELDRRFEQNNIDPCRPLLAPQKLYVNKEAIFSSLKELPRIDLNVPAQNDQPAPPLDTPKPKNHNPAKGHFRFDSSVNPDLSIETHADRPLHRLSTFLERLSPEVHTKIVVCVESNGRREMLLEQLRKQQIEAISASPGSEHSLLTPESDSSQVIVAIAKFNQGAQITTANGQQRLLIVAESELFGVTLKPKAQQEKARAHIAEAAIHSLLELNEGAPVVHIDHGVGRYLGLERMPVMLSANERVDAEFLTLEYAKGDKLYVPVTNLHLIGRYMGGDEDSAPMDKLGSEHWQTLKKKALKNVKDTAAELLAIYAKREALKGFACQLPQQDYDKFSAQFPFEPTHDQQNAIDAVIRDMRSEQPMDRVVCGDVGFGKTEVAMRAAFVAVQNSRQVMILVPTTLLAQQHANSFAERFADWPIKVDVLSRFRTAAEQKKVLQEFSSGKLDILIGTHRLIQKDISAAELGLVVIDEEHRFGVSQKEQLKKMCVNVDLLTMTATPIPRTLNLAMSGLRDLSIIATPPSRRLSVKTFVQEKQPSLIKEALLRELLRGGQVFYLHNDIDKINLTADDIQKLVPEARVVVGHGQMPERELEQVMHSFYHKQFNVLVCTTIIETGIDIPNANTIIIERADKFGLAQLHQLRGRVGRSHHQAYAYLFTPHKKALTNDANKRLKAIQESQDLGAGFMLATHDMEIRGAGELLGSQQSGQIHGLGYSMYLEMLEQAVQSIRAGEEIDIESVSNPHGEINLHIPALIPDDYLPDIQLRLTLYKRIANAESNEALRELKVEMIDRFGLLPQQVKNLFTVTELKLKVQPLGIERIDSSPSGGFLEFAAKTKIQPIKIVNLVQEQPRIFKFKGATKLSFTLAFENPEKRVEWLYDFIDKLAS